MTTWRLAPPIVADELKLRLACPTRHSRVVPHQARSARAGRKANAIEMTDGEMRGKQDQHIQSRTYVQPTRSNRELCREEITESVRVIYKTFHRSRAEKTFEDTFSEAPRRRAEEKPKVQRAHVLLGR